MSVRRTLAAALAAGLLLAGCSDEPEPRFAPTESPSPSESETTAEPEPEAQTPEAFIREWVELDREMQTSGDTASYLEVSAQCAPCMDVATQVSEIYEQGGEIRTQGWSVSEIQRVSKGNRYRLEGQASPVTIVEARGGKPRTLAGGSITYELVLGRVSGEWQLRDLLEVAT